ncbi:MAG: PHP domain-containing protein [Sedimentibacter sp.]|nr:PHP domain-containing protein [Tissierellia bacterium]
MKLKADYHIHSTYSKNRHGKSSIEEIAERAYELGLEEIAITDHGPAHYLFGIKRNLISEAKNIVVETRKKYPNLKILYGVEANILDYKGTTDIDNEILKHCDIILCGFHLAALFSTSNDFWNFIVKNKFAKNNKNLYDEMVEKNTQAIINAMNKYKIDILTHPGDKIPVNIDKIAQAAEKTNTMLEINNSHGHLNKDEIITASKYNVQFVINSDSHIKDNVGSCDNALRATEEAGIDLKRIINLC